jgi:ribose transport system permease protein
MNMTSDTGTIPSGTAPTNRATWQLLDRLSGLLYFLVLLLLFVILKPGALTPGSASTLLQLSIPLLVIATGMTFCLVCGEVDLSVAGVAGLTSTVTALQLDHGAGWPVAVGLGLAVGLFIGMINGGLTAWLAASFPRFPSFLVTLATLSITTGTALALQPMQQPIAINSPEFKNIFGFTDSVIGSYPTWYAIAVVAIAYFVLTKSRFGYAMYSVGTNARAAKLVGFGVLRTKFWVLTVSGLLAAFGGILMAGYVQAGFHVIATGIEVDAIAAAVIGGTALFGGRGTVLGTIVGVLTLGLLNTGLLIMEIHVNGQLIIKGALVILALVIGEYVRERAIRS